MQSCDATAAYWRTTPTMNSASGAPELTRGEFNLILNLSFRYQLSLHLARALGKPTWPPPHRQSKHRQQSTYGSQSMAAAPPSSTRESGFPAEMLYRMQSDRIFQMPARVKNTVCFTRSSYSSMARKQSNRFLPEHKAFE